MLALVTEMETIYGNTQSPMLKRNECQLHRHNYNCQERTFFQNYLISEMGNKLVSLVGISTLMQYSKSFQDQTPSDSSSFHTFTKQSLSINKVSTVCAEYASLHHQCKTGLCRGEGACNEEIHLACTSKATSKLSTCLP